MKKAYTRFSTACSFLTRIPLPGQARLDFSPDTLVGSMAWYPTVGLVFGLLAAVIFMAASALQLDPTVSAFGLLIIPYLLNRFLHFDGLCDVLDGFLADRPAAERLAIMKDSRNGSFAMGGGILFLLGKYLFLLNLVETGFSALPLILLTPVIARWVLVPMAYKAHYPRERGTALALVGRIPLSVLLIASLQMLAIMAGGFLVSSMIEQQELLPLPNQHLLASGLALVAAVVASGFWMLILRWISWRKIGGITGDVLGCLCETAEAGAVAVGFLVIHFLV